MSTEVALEEYAKAFRLGQKEYRELLMAGKDPHPAVLDEILPELSTETVLNIGLVDIPANRIVGTKTAGRITAFTPSFRPLLEAKSEFGIKWVLLCEAHLGATGYELDVSKMTPEEIAEIAPRIEDYHAMEELVLHGDLYRLSSPFDSNLFAFELVAKDQSEAHITVMQLLMVKNCEACFLRLEGLDPQAVYEEKTSGARYHGSTLMHIGLSINRDALRDLNTAVWHFVRVS